MLENKVNQVKANGYTTSGPCSAVCALAFGKEEGGDFTFDQENIDSIVADNLAHLSGAMADYKPELQPFYLRPLVHLCVSDVNKMLLVQCSDLSTLLAEALLLDPGHMRQESG